ncbi:MAG TPA: flagellar hook basal-body protein [Candidatus Binatia bacterium]|nr:flagellar hook basal-body protein [Candidatus Binatia bacterium]
MTVGNYIAASGGMAALARLEAVAHNLANANTAGYKAERPVFRLRQDVQPAPTEPLRMTAGAQVVQADTVFDFSTGPIQATGNPLDVAIPGPEFFAVRTDAGERYTRQGIFQLDPEGYLVTTSGRRVQGTNGDLRLPPGRVEIAEDGGIYVEGVEAGRLKLVRFADPPPLVPEGDTLFAPKPGTAGTPVPEDQVHLDPASIEGSNVSAVGSLIELVDVSRSYESYMRALQQMDQVSGHAIDDVGKVE